jgi:hypothetical protein
LRHRREEANCDHALFPGWQPATFEHKLRQHVLYQGTILISGIVPDTNPYSFSPPLMFVLALV